MAHLLSSRQWRENKKPAIGQSVRVTSRYGKWRGKITEIDGCEITLRSADGRERTYAIREWQGHQALATWGA